MKKKISLTLVLMSSLTSGFGQQKVNFQTACHPEDVKHYDTKTLRERFVMEKVMVADEINLTYSHYDRFIFGGAMPVNKTLKLENFLELGLDVDPGIKETTIWEGDVDINWGDYKVFLSAEDLANVPVGATVRLVYEIIDADYHALRITNQDWSQDIVPQIDGFDAQPSPFAFEYTADAKAIADDKGMLITGFGYKLTKVTFAK
jgi:hypothetical protein